MWALFIVFYYQMPDYKHKHFSEGLPEHGRVLHRNAGSGQFRAGAGNELDHKFPDRLLSAGYYRRWSVLFVQQRDLPSDQ